MLLNLKAQTREVQERAKNHTIIKKEHKKKKNLMYALLNQLCFPCKPQLQICQFPYFKFREKTLHLVSNRSCNKLLTIFPFL